MKRYNIIYIVVLFIIFHSCKSVNKSQSEENNQQYVGDVIDCILGPNINSPNSEEQQRTVYSDFIYSKRQRANNQFKDNAPFVQIYDHGEKERLWYTSSRLDDNYGKTALASDLYQQIYYSEREVGEGKLPAEGWSSPKRFIIENSNSVLTGFFNDFNNISKGAVTISGDLMVFSAEQVVDDHNIYNRQLWQVQLEEDGGFGIPKPIDELSGQKTWETQPTLSADGQHMFFVSNRVVDSQSFTTTENQPSSRSTIFYTYKRNNHWVAPVVVKEIFIDSCNQITPSITSLGDKLMFASKTGNNMDLFEIDIELHDGGGYRADKSTVKLLSHNLIYAKNQNTYRLDVNDNGNQKYPFYYHNPKNKLTSNALFWAADNPSEFDGYNIYACEIPFSIEYNLIIVDDDRVDETDKLLSPVLSVRGFEKNEIINDTTLQSTLIEGVKYNVLGGSRVIDEGDLYLCNYDPKYIFIGYTSADSIPNVKDKRVDMIPTSGAVHYSKRCHGAGNIMFNNLQQDTVVYDTIHLAKVWHRKPLCPEVINIEPKHRSIPYFQTGYWGVNTSENLKRDLELMHDGFVFAEGEDIYNPKTGIVRERSDYHAQSWEVNPLYPIKKADDRKYSIGNARWIELHPNNLYWGDRVGFSYDIQSRMEGRKKRINQYVEFAKQVDENIKMLTDSVVNNYFGLLEKHADSKPKLLIEIFAVSDQREVIRGWYIGDPVEYRSTEFIEDSETYITEMVKIVQPEIDEENKKFTKLLPCTLEKNSEGNNGTRLGMSDKKTDRNTNLSRLRAWFGYQEIYNALAQHSIFKQYLEDGLIALPNNEVSYDDAEVIIITRGKRQDESLLNLSNPYPVPNNPNSSGYYDYDVLRRVEIQVRFLMDQEEDVVRDYCCDMDE